MSLPSDTIHYLKMKVFKNEQQLKPTGPKGQGFLCSPICNYGIISK